MNRIEGTMQYHAEVVVLRYAAGMLAHALIFQCAIALTPFQGWIKRRLGLIPQWAKSQCFAVRKPRPSRSQERRQQTGSVDDVQGNVMWKKA
jgi:hypothetical protein